MAGVYQGGALHKTPFERKAPSLAHKYYIQMQVYDSDKHVSLLLRQKGLYHWGKLLSSYIHIESEKDLKL